MKCTKEAEKPVSSEVVGGRLWVVGSGSVVWLVINKLLSEPRILYPSLIIHY
jgi:hypothetical protein